MRTTWGILWDEEKWPSNLPLSGYPEVTLQLISLEIYLTRLKCPSHRKDCLNKLDHTVRELPRAFYQYCGVSTAWCEAKLRSHWTSFRVMLKIFASEIKSSCSEYLLVKEPQINKWFMLARTRSRKKMPLLILQVLEDIKSYQIIHYFIWSSKTSA